MKKLSTSFCAILFTLFALESYAQGITTPRAPSPEATVSQKIGISTVTVRYSRPSVKGREVWGNLVPFGWNVQPFGAGNEAPWRAGANENTIIEFSHPATVQDKPVPAGSYGLFFVINKDNTAEVILSKDYRSWGSFWYNAEQDQLRAPIQVRDLTPSRELLTFDFLSIDKNSTELALTWEKKQFPINIKFAVDEIVMSNASEELKGPIGFTWQGYSSAANYALINKVNLDQAVTWIDRAIAQNKNFTTLNIKSGLLQEAGKAAEADMLKKEALALATEAELNNYGYQLLGQEQHDKAIEILKLATERFPKSANAWDSLGEAYALKGDKKNAVPSFKKSLSLNPPDNVKVNSQKYLKQFGAL
jgi:tetratricopeptide (TPR) repeat protein